jgi:hypothetical protein
MSQIFRKHVPIHIVYDLLDKVNNNEFSKEFYIFTISSYKKLCYNKNDIEFLSIISPYYYASKMFYVERQHTYKSFCTIIRQICKLNQIKIMTKTTYYNSSYYMDYYIERKPEIPIETVIENVNNNYLLDNIER